MRFFQFLLQAFPKSFRNEYASQMQQTFDQQRRATPAPLLPLFWLRTIGETLANALGVHLDILRHDLRYAVRSFRRSPGFTLTAVIVAALGIGATTAAYTLVDHVVIRPLPFPDSAKLLKLYEDHSFSGGAGATEWDMSPANFRDFKNSNSTLENLGAFRGLAVNLSSVDMPEHVEGSSFTADLFPILGVKPMLGRVFTAEDDRDNAPGTVVLSYELWQRDFGGDPAVLGRKIRLDDQPYEIIGVMPRDFYFPFRTALLWTAMRWSPQNFEERNDTYIYGIGRLKPGVSATQAAAEVRTIAARLQSAYPKEMAHISATLIPLHDDLSAGPRTLLYVLLAASACVLLVACTNLASLLLARALHRRRELAVRAALGAGRERLVRQLLTESLIIAMIGGGIGLALAYAAMPLLVRLVPVYLPIAEVPPIDLRVIAFAFVLTLATGIGFGVFPALRVSRRDDASALRETSRSGGGRRERLRSALVVAEVTGAVVLLVSCGLLIRAMGNVAGRDPGFRSQGALTLRTSLPMPKYETRPPREQFYQKVLAEARRLPGVDHVAYTSFMPMITPGGVWPVEVEGQPQEPSAQRSASLRFVTPGYFATMGIPLKLGRDVEESDTFTSQFVAIVSDSLVQRYWPGQNPLGRHFNFGNYQRTIIGVAGNVRVRGLERAESEPQVYLAYKQEDKVSTWYAPKDLVIHSSGNPQTLVPALRRIIREADPALPVSGVQLVSDIVASQTGTRRVQATALGAFAVIAFLLAAIGIHGLLAFAVSNRTQEIGVRLALGASAGNILSMILREGVALALTGIVIGAGLAYASGRALQALLAGVAPYDAETFLAAIGLCVLMTMLGSLAPALRAIRIDPTTAIRAE